MCLFRSPSENEKEIYMYDVATQTVSKLDGELSAAFVDAAESNASEEKEKPAPSNVVETRIPYTEKDLEENVQLLDDQDQSDAASEYVESKVPIIDPTEADLETEASEQLESFSDISGMSIHPQGDLVTSASSSLDNHVSISSGYSRTDVNGVGS